MENFTLNRTDLGIKQWTLQSHQADLPQEGGDINLETPHIEVYQPGKPPTLANSEHGLFIQQSQNIHLTDHVVVVTRNNEDHSATTLRTEILDYVSKEKKFKTDQLVVIERPGSVMKGVGMIANQDLSEIHILHQETAFQ